MKYNAAFLPIKKKELYNIISQINNFILTTEFYIRDSYKDLIINNKPARLKILSRSATYLSSNIISIEEDNEYVNILQPSTVILELTFTNKNKTEVIHFKTKFNSDKNSKYYSRLINNVTAIYQSFIALKIWREV